MKPMKPAAWAALLVLATGAAAQPESDSEVNDGRWSAVVENSAAGYRSARVDIAEYAGFWHDTSPAAGVKPRTCAGKRFKVTVQRTRSTEMEFMVWGSSVSKDCPDLSVQLKPTADGKAMEGSIGDEGRVRLVRRR